MEFRAPTEQIRLPLNVPAGCNDSLIVHLSYMLRSTNEDPPPIVLDRDGDGWRVRDGRHRFIAAVMAGRRDVLAVTAD